MLLLHLPAAWAAEGDSTRTSGMAGAGAANWEDVDILRRSPAAMVLGVGYSMQGDVAWWRDGVRLSSGLMDTQNGALGAGVAYSREWSTRSPTDEELPGWIVAGEDPVDQVREQSVRIGMGYGMLERPYLEADGARTVRRLGVGAGAAWSRGSSTLSGTTRSGYEFNASVAGLAHPTLALSGTVNGLFGLGSEPVWVEGGLYWRPVPWLGVAADGGWDPRLEGPPVVARTGLRATWEDTVTGSLGYAWEGGAQTVAGGLSIEAQGIRAAYAIQVGLPTGEYALSVVHSAGLRAEF